MNNQDNPMAKVREIVQKAMKEKGITIDDVRADLAAYRRGEEYTYGEEYIEEDDFVPYMNTKAWDDFE
jgi:hypothetical protein